MGMGIVEEGQDCRQSFDGSGRCDQFNCIEVKKLGKH